MPRKPAEDTPVRTTVRMPSKLKGAIEQAAKHNGRPVNEEIVARLRVTEDARLASIESELQEMKGMLRKLLDAAG
jgi:hypothetical protein